MAKTPQTPAPQQQGSSQPGSQMGGSASPAPQQGQKPIFKDWASI
jgi:hypothetical protein